MNSHLLRKHQFISILFHREGIVHVLSAGFDRMEDGDAGHFLKILFQVRFIEGYFMARLFTIVSFTNMPDLYTYLSSMVHIH